MTTSKKRGGLICMMAGLLAAASMVSAPVAQEQPVRVGFPNQTEQAMLGYMAALIVEKKFGLEVELSPNLGGTAIGQQAIIQGAIDIFPDYTGDALANVLREDPLTNPEEAYDRVKSQYAEKYDIVWLAPTKFNNTYALALKTARAEEMGVSTISDLESHAGNLSLGSSVEFAARPLDGYPGLTNAYGFRFGSIKPMDIGLMYTSVDSGQVDVIVAFATDARIGKLGLTVLDDDKFFFPAYNGAITVRQDLLDRHPEIGPAIDEVIGNIDTQTQVRLNERADIDNIPLEVVAEDYLREIGVID